MFVGSGIKNEDVGFEEQWGACSMEDEGRDNLEPHALIVLPAQFSTWYKVPQSDFVKKRQGVKHETTVY